MDLPYAPPQINESDRLVAVVNNPAEYIPVVQEQAE